MTCSLESITSTTKCVLSHICQTFIVPRSVLTMMAAQALMVPLKERFLLEEFPVWGASLQSRSVSDVSKTPQEKPTHLRPPQSSDGAASAGGKPKKTVRRFSDMVNSSEKDKKPPSMGSKKDIWIIRLSDVVLKCQRVGITTRPLGAALTKDSKGRKHTGPKRNLYRFLNVERWEPQLAYGHPAPVSATMVVDDEDAHDEEEEEVDEFDSQGGPSRMSYVLRLRGKTRKKSLLNCGGRWTDSLMRTTSLDQCSRLCPMVVLALSMALKKIRIQKRHQSILLELRSSAPGFEAAQAGQQHRPCALPRPPSRPCDGGRTKLQPPHN